MSSPIRHLVIGCGYLGMGIALNRASEGVAALTRSRLELRELGIHPLLCDIHQPESLKQLQELGELQTVTYAVGFDRSSGRSFRETYVDGLANVLRVLPHARFVYISSTSVYGQTNGEWVDETSPTEPTESNGQIILEAEQTLREFRPDSIILRFAGIYGPKRYIRQAAILKGEPYTADADKWLNLIHVRDGEQAAIRAADLGTAGGTYLVSDGTPVTRRSFYTEMAKRLQAPEPIFTPTEGNAVEPNRRVNNAKLLAELGLMLRYPSYIEGLAELLAPAKDGHGA